MAVGSWSWKPSSKPKPTVFCSLSTVYGASCMRDFVFAFVQHFEKQWFSGGRARGRRHPPVACLGRAQVSNRRVFVFFKGNGAGLVPMSSGCLLYTSDAADE